MAEKRESDTEGSVPKYSCSFTFPYSAVLPRTHPMCCVYPTSQNKEENAHKNIISTFSRKNENMYEYMDVKQFTKKDYTRIVQEKRKHFIHDHFGKILQELFDKLEEEADKMRNCHHEVIFDCPEYFDVDKTESVLREYFKDIGFETVASLRKDGVSTIVLTIT